jgi:hypothetical protein
MEICASEIEMKKPLLYSLSVLISILLSGCGTNPLSANPNRNFSSSFAQNGVLKETGSPNESSDPNWWLNSGAYLYFNGKTAATIQGELPEKDPRRLRYFETNPSETDNGYHPQNIFRLVTRTKWQSYTQQVYFKINRYILSPDPQRQASNGLLLFNHYQDGDNLYYTGLRVDGAAIIKKKIKGEYFTLASKPILMGAYNRDKNPNLIPLNTWIGIRSIVTSHPDHSVGIQVYSDIGKTGKWVLMIAVQDNDSRFGGPPMDQTGYAGIRTDFMDAEFADFSIQENQD